MSIGTAPAPKDRVISRIQRGYLAPNMSSQQEQVVTVSAVGPKSRLTLLATGNSSLRRGEIFTADTVSGSFEYFAGYQGGYDIGGQLISDTQLHLTADQYVGICWEIVEYE